MKDRWSKGSNILWTFLALAPRKNLSGVVFKEFFYFTAAKHPSNRTSVNLWTMIICIIQKIFFWEGAALNLCFLGRFDENQKKIGYMNDNRIQSNEISSFQIILAKSEGGDRWTSSKFPSKVGLAQAKICMEEDTAFPRLRHCCLGYFERCAVLVSMAPASSENSVVCSAAWNN